ncbi:hypothetical protein [Streptomyces roseicoloratus]|uniref:hypothetical protein n=1 Tax=Streptomyces roseicoloratus TaxID=2508722 RepID=UPI001009D252|nr:hypothetical protein [Streptomyces roseicoloratus]
MGGTAHLTPRKRLKAVAWFLAGAAVLGALAYGGSFVLDRLTQPSRAEQDQRTQEDLDRAEAPFTAGVDYDDTPPGPWKVVLDRPLTAAEQRRIAAMRDPGAAREYLTSLGGRTLRFPAAFERRTDLAMTYYPRDATVLHVNLFSKRQTQLTITAMEAVNVSCRPPTARTVLVLPPQGGAAYDGVLFDLGKPGAVPIITDEGDDQGRPYFGPRKIDLGDGASPGGLRVEAVAKGESCTWEIKAKYRDAYQSFGSVILKDGTKPFFAEAAPDRPEQLWYWEASRPNGQQWVPCHRKPAESVCDEWRRLRAEARADQG